jgi:hypothetical protein
MAGGDIVAGLFEGHLVVLAADVDPPRFLADGGLVPAGLLPVGGADVDLAIADKWPDPGGCAVGGPVLAERGDI